MIGREAKAAVCAALGADGDVDAAFDQLCAEYDLYQHKKGGIYRKLFDARHSEDGSALVVYEHLWPHARGVWVRPAGMFYEPERFKALKP